MDICALESFARERPSTLLRVYADPRGRAVRCFAVSEGGALAVVCLEPYAAAALATAAASCSHSLPFSSPAAAAAGGGAPRRSLRERRPSSRLSHLLEGLGGPPSSSEERDAFLGTAWLQRTARRAQQQGGMPPSNGSSSNSTQQGHPEPPREDEASGGPRGGGGAQKLFRATTKDVEFQGLIHLAQRKLAKPNQQITSSSSSKEKRIYSAASSSGLPSRAGNHHGRGPPPVEKTEGVPNLSEGSFTRAADDICSTVHTPLGHTQQKEQQQQVQQQVQEQQLLQEYQEVQRKADTGCLVLLDTRHLLPLREVLLSAATADLTTAQLLPTVCCCCCCCNLCLLGFCLRCKPRASLPFRGHVGGPPTATTAAAAAAAAVAAAETPTEGAESAAGSAAAASPSVPAATATAAIPAPAAAAAAAAEWPSPFRCSSVSFACQDSCLVLLDPKGRVQLLALRPLPTLSRAPKAEGVPRTEGAPLSCRAETAAGWERRAAAAAGSSLAAAPTAAAPTAAAVEAAPTAAPATAEAARTATAAAAAAKVHTIGGPYPRQLARLIFLPCLMEGGPQLLSFRLLRLGTLQSQQQHEALLASQWLIDRWSGPTCGGGPPGSSPPGPREALSKNACTQQADQAAARTSSSSSSSRVAAAGDLVQASARAVPLLQSFEGRNRWERDPLDPWSLPSFQGPCVYGEALLQLSGGPPLRLLIDFTGQRVLRCVSVLSQELAFSCLTFAPAPAAAAAAAGLCQQEQKQQQQQQQQVSGAAGEDPPEQVEAEAASPSEQQHHEASEQHRQQQQQQEQQQQSCLQQLQQTKQQHCKQQLPPEEEHRQEQQQRQQQPCEQQQGQPSQQQQQQQEEELPSPQQQQQEQEQEELALNSVRPPGITCGVSVGKRRGGGRRVGDRDRRQRGTKKYQEFLKSNEGPPYLLPGAPPLEHGGGALSFPSAERSAPRLKQGAYAYALFRYTAAPGLKLTTGLYTAQWGAPSPAVQETPKTLGQMLRDYPVAAFKQQLQSEGRVPLISLPPFPPPAAAAADAAFAADAAAEADCGRWLLALALPCGMVVVVDLHHRVLASFRFPSARAGFFEHVEVQEGGRFLLAWREKLCVVFSLVPAAAAAASAAAATTAAATAAPVLQPLQDPLRSFWRKRPPHLTRFEDSPGQQQQEQQQQQQQQQRQRGEDEAAAAQIEGEDMGEGTELKEKRSCDGQGDIGSDCMDGKAKLTRMLAVVSPTCPSLFAEKASSGGRGEQGGSRLGSSVSRVKDEEAEVLNLRVYAEVPVGARYGQSGAKMERLSLLRFSSDPLLQWLAVVSRKGVAEKVLYFLDLRSNAHRGVSLNDFQLDTATLPMILQMEWLPGSASSLLVLPEHRRFLGLLKHAPSLHSDLCAVQPYLHFPLASSNRQDLQAAWDFDRGSSSSSSSSSDSRDKPAARAAAARSKRKERMQRGRQDSRLSLHNHLSIKTQWHPLASLRRLQEAPPTAWLTAVEAEAQHQSTGSACKSFDAFAAALGGRKKEDVQREAQLSLLYASYLRGQDPTSRFASRNFAARLLLLDNDLCQPVYAYNGVFGPSSFWGSSPSRGAFPERGGSPHSEGGQCCSLTDVGSAVGLWGFIDAAIRMQAAASLTPGVGAEGASVEAEGGPPRGSPEWGAPPINTRGVAPATTRRTRVAQRLKELLAHPPAEAQLPPAAPDETAGSAAAAAAAASPGWRVRPESRQTAAATTAAAAAAPIRSVEDMLLSIKRRHPPSSLLPPLRRCRPEVPSHFCMSELLNARASQVERDYAADSKAEEAWWEELRARAALHPHAHALHAEGMHAKGLSACEEGEDGLGLRELSRDNRKEGKLRFVSLEDVVHASLFDGDPLVRAGRKYRNNWRLPVVWPGDKHLEEH
ncbi:hypothetical protein Esti_002007 [Eimeria stiedai]